MFAVTLNQLRASNAFGDLGNTYSHLRRLLGKIEGSRSLLHPFGRAYGLDTPVTIAQIASAYSVEVALMALRADGNWQPSERDRIILRFVVEVSSHVLHVFEELFPNDERPRTAINVAQTCLEFYGRPYAWLAEHGWYYGFTQYTSAAAHAALDSANAVAVSDARAEAAKYAAWSAGKAAVVAFDCAWPTFCEEHLEKPLSASERAEFLTWACDAADEAAQYGMLAAIMSGDSTYELEWHRSRFLEILAAENQGV